MSLAPSDVLVIGGGINGAGIAADAAGRGLSTVLVEAGDLGGATSSASSKLIHGGLRYLEYYEFRLVREALQEREVLLARAPHFIWPLRFILPYGSGMRPRWMIRAGLFLYDHLARRNVIPSSRAIRLDQDPSGHPLKFEDPTAFCYWDCWVDDARLVVANARLAARKGATVLTRTRVTALRREGAAWVAELSSADGMQQCRANAVVNATGPWVSDVARRVEGAPEIEARTKTRLVKGSHIVVPRVDGAEDAYLFQNSDGRVVFLLPFEHAFTLIGTTDIPFEGDLGCPRISEAEQAYLLRAANCYLAKPLSASDIVWSFAGVRPLQDDGAANPSALSRDYRLDRFGDAGAPPLISVVGGKVTTYRRLAEGVMDLLAPDFPAMGPAWTAREPLPGGDLGGLSFEAFVAGLAQRYRALPQSLIWKLARRFGSDTERVLGDARSFADLGPDLGGGLRAREVAYLKAEEWAATPDDILWRRTKAGLHLPTEAARNSAVETLARFL